MIFVLMAAHDTSTMTMSQMVYWTAKNPQWQDRARAQSLELEPEIGYDTLGKFTELDLIMRESLRMPTGPGVAADGDQDTQILGHYIPEGSIVAVLQQTNHRDPTYYTNPNIFDPERFHLNEKRTAGTGWRGRRSAVEHQMYQAAFRSDGDQDRDAPAAARIRMVGARRLRVPMDYSSLPV